MSSLPAICDDCGTTFIAKKAIKIGGGVTVHMTNVGVGPCPNCGGWGSAFDGIYTVAYNGTQEALTAELVNPDQIQQFIATLNSAIEERPDPTELVAQIETDAPGLSDFAELIRSKAENIIDVATPENAGEFWTMVAVIVAILTLLTT